MGDKITTSGTYTPQILGVTKLTERIAKKIIDNKDKVPHIEDGVFDILSQALDSTNKALQPEYFQWVVSQYSQQVYELFLTFHNTDKEDFDMFLPKIQKERKKPYADRDQFYVYISSYKGYHVYGKWEVIEQFLRSVGVVDSTIIQAKGTVPNVEKNDYQIGFVVGEDGYVKIEIIIYIPGRDDDAVVAMEKSSNQVRWITLPQIYTKESNLGFIRTLFTEPDTDITEGFGQTDY